MLGQLMTCMAAMLKDYKAEIEDILVTDKQLAKELLFDMKQAEQAAKLQQQQQAGAARRAGAGASGTPLHPSHPQARSAGRATDGHGAGAHSSGLTSGSQTPARADRGHAEGGSQQEGQEGQPPPAARTPGAALLAARRYACNSCVCCGYQLLGGRTDVQEACTVADPRWISLDYPALVRPAIQQHIIWLQLLPAQKLARMFMALCFSTCPPTICSLPHIVVGHR
jgi:hypothetical protein